MKTVLKYYKPYLIFFLLNVVALFGQAMCEMALPGYMSEIINNGIVAGNMAYIKKTGVMMLVVAAGSMIFAVAGSGISAWTAAKASKDIRESLFKKVTNFAAAELEMFSTASLITRATNDIQAVQNTSVMLMRLACLAPLMGLVAVIKALQTSIELSWTVGIALIAILVIMGLSFVLVFSKFKVLQSKLDRVNLIMKERLAGTLVVRAFNREKAEQHRFDEANVDLTSLNLFVNKAMSFMMPALMFVMNAVSILIVWVGSHYVEAQTLMIGDMLAYLQYAMHVIMSFLYITVVFIMVPRAFVSAQRIGEVLDTEPTIEDPANPQVVSNVRGQVEFKNVSFSYPDAEENAIEGISFVAQPGKTTAIIGGTGSGKSTLISMIPRFYDATEGQVLIDGIDIKDMTQHDVREQIGYVPQKGLLFAGTIGTNLQYGKEDATEAEMIEAAETAQAINFINEKEHRFDEEVAQGGTSVSGGQKQRLSIARALIKKPAIYIFDDSFSALDFSTDKALRSALKEKVGDSTIIIVAQRINTILDADQIIVLDDGVMVGKGTHRELMSNCEVYKEIALSQLSEAELERGRE